MGAIHDLILNHGKNLTRDLVHTTDRALVDIASSVLADENGEISTSFSGFCLLTALPHKRLEDNETWERTGHRVSIRVEPGFLPVRGDHRLYGIPYGARARLLLVYMQSIAMKTRSRVVEMGDNMNAWLTRMDIKPGGETYRSIHEQTKRISACNLTFFWDGDERKEGFRRTSIVSGGFSMVDIGKDCSQPLLWQPTIELSEPFYKALNDHPVPLSEAAIRALKEKSMSLDIYIWLAYRLHRLNKAQRITWPALHGQFGGGYKLVRQFKVYFQQALLAALSAYPDAHVDIEDDAILLLPSRPPIARISA
jgi:hypothetical protein